MDVLEHFQFSRYHRGLTVLLGGHLKSGPKLWDGNSTLECCVDNAVVGSWNLPRPTTFSGSCRSPSSLLPGNRLFSCGPIAQLAELSAHNRKDSGSTPDGSTT